MSMPTDLVREFVATFLYCVGSAMVPVFNAETYLVAMGIRADAGLSLTWWLALAAATGQMAGKLVFYAIGRGAFAGSWLQSKAVANGRWNDRLARCQTWAHRHNWGPATLTLLSAAAGVPPFAVWSVVAGSLRTRWWIYLSCGLAGRYLRFAALLGASTLARQVVDHAR